jgi:hypothetical protein
MFNMSYRKVVFAMPDGRPGIVEYGIQTMQGDDERLVGIHIRQIEDSVDFHEDASVRDGVLNRLLELELKGISVRYIRLVVSSLQKAMEYEFAASMMSADTASGRLVKQPIEIHKADIRAGEIWLSSVNPRFVSNAA